MTETPKQEQKYSTKAKIAAAIASLLLLNIRIRFTAVLIALIATLATIFAIIGLYEIRKNHPLLKGTELCIYALVVSSIAYLIFAWVIADKLIVTQQEIVYEELITINKILKDYKSETGCWPTTTIGLSFLDHHPKDPWGNDYLYQYTGDCVDDDRSEYFTIYTLGKDAKDGGKKDNADLAYKSKNYRLYVNGEPTVP